MVAENNTEDEVEIKFMFQVTLNIKAWLKVFRLQKDE